MTGPAAGERVRDRIGVRVRVRVRIKVRVWVRVRVRVWVRVWVIGVSRSRHREHTELVRACRRNRKE